MTTRPFLPSLALFALVTLADGAAYALPPWWFAANTYVCRDARSAQAPRGEPKVAKFARATVVTIDRFSEPNDGRAVDAVRPTLVCESDHAPGHLEAYTTKPPRPRRNEAPFAPRTIEVTRLTAVDGPTTLQLTAPGTLLVPAVASDYAPLPARDGALRCYDVAQAPGAARTRVVPEPETIIYRGTLLTFETLAPTRLCIPAELDGEPPTAPAFRTGLLCSGARLKRSRSQPALAALVTPSNNRFGRELLRLRKLREFCEPVDLGPGPHPACAQPIPTATATPTVAPTAARDTLESLSLSPPTIARLPGESKHFVVTGHFPGGVTQDLTGEVRFASSDPAVAVAPNDSADPSRVDLLAKGTTTISATDPITGVSSTASGGDATLIATGPLQFITIAQEHATIVLKPCQSAQFTATGHYEDGVVRNLTQDVVWSTESPDVATAPNAAGDRSRIFAVAPGRTGIRATDPRTGMAAYCCTQLAVEGGLIAIYLEPTPRYSDFTPVRAPAVRRLAAVGFYEGSFRRADITEELVFTSDAPAVVQTPNTPGDRGKLLVVGGGTAAITATDPDTAVMSPSISLRGLDGLRALSIPSSANPRFAVAVGGRLSLTVLAEFSDGLAIAQDVRLVSSDPTIAVVESGGIRGLKPGTVTISAFDIPTGISTTQSGNDITLGVTGAPQRLTMEPREAKRLVGQDRGYGVRLFYEGGYSELVGQRTQLTVTNTAVAQARTFWPPNVVTAVGTGRTQVAAFDPVTGLSTTTTGDDATLIVLGPLAAVTVKPSTALRAAGRTYFYAAIGRDAAGETLNLTQDVMWSSTDPLVARITNGDGERSKTETLTAGRTFISAVDPLTGISSTASNGDAQLDVIGSVVRLRLTSEVVTLHPGDDWQVTTTGVDADARTTNLTQEVVYASSNPGVVTTTNEADHRSRIIAVAPGTATISATDPLSGVTSTATGGDLLITVTAP